MNRHTVKDLIKLKSNGNKITAVTCYDFFSARAVQDAEIPLALVGDSASMVVYGYDTTVPITIEEIILLVRAVLRGNKSSLIVADMPFMSYQGSVNKAVDNAGRLIKDGGAHAVKLEGGSVIKNQIAAILDAGIPVVGHLGLLPQSINKLGGYSLQATSESSQKKIIDEAILLEGLGVCAIVLECIPASIANDITASLKVPTIGIGAGGGCDGHIQVLHDLLGLGGGQYPKHSHQYEQLGVRMVDALSRYKNEVESGSFKV